MNGIYLIDKEAGWTSFDVVAKMRGLTGIRKIGHAGTLDPFATGLLIVLVGKEATKRQAEFMKLDKEYEAVLELGKTSTTGDPEGIISEFPISNFQLPIKSKITNVQKKVNTPSSHSGLPARTEVHSGGDPESKSLIRQSDSSQVGMTLERIKKALENFIGEIEQVPPIYSAIKIKGKKAYELARAGKTVELKPRNVIIHKIDILDYKWPSLTLKVSCGSGTYIRSLAADIGKALKTGAYVKELKRTKIGDFDLKKAKKISEF